MTNTSNGRTWLMAIAFVAVMVSGCSDNGATGPGGLSLSGSWTGTAGGQALAFTVDGSSIKGLDVFVPITSGNCGVAGIRRQYVPTFAAGTISGDAFSVSESGLTMTGVFSSSSAASGTATLTLTTSSMGGACSGSGSTSWSATKQ